MRSLRVGNSRRILLTLFLLPSLLFSQESAKTADDLLLAQRLFRQGEFRSAGQEFQAIIDRQPSPAAYAGLVQSLIKADDVKPAEAKSRQALNAFPHAAATHAARGDVLFRRGLLTEADDEYKIALKLDEKCARAWLGSGKIEDARARRRLAWEDVSRAHELDPQDGDALYEWAIRQPYPANVAGLEQHLAEFHSDPEIERHEHEYLDLLKALAGRKVWILNPEVKEAVIKLEPLTFGPGFEKRGYGVRVGFNDRASLTLLLDTGSSGVTVTRKFAEKIGAHKLSDQTLQGIGKGSAPGYQAWVDKVVIGDLQFKDCFVHVVPQMPAGTDGMIGTDIFTHFLVTLDFPAHRLSLAPLFPSAAAEPQAAAEAFSPVYGFGHILLLPVKATDKASGLFVVDTGSNVSTVSNELSSLLKQMRLFNAQTLGVGGGTNSAFLADDVTLQFAGLRRRDQRLITIDLHSVSKNLGTEISGQIGFATLENLKLIIDYRDGLVKAEEKAK